jgi:hypothetical protein
VVRGTAALLALVAAALAYFPAASALPALADRDTAIAVAGAAGLAFVVGLAVTPVPAVGVAPALAPALLGGALVVGALAAADATAAATPVESILCGCLGVAFASLLDERALVVALPLFVGAIDVSGVVGGAPGTLLAQNVPAAGDPLTLELPRWGGGAPVAQASVADVVFVAAYTAYAQRYRLRPRASALAMLAALIGTLALTLALDRRVPALAFVSAAYLAVNADRLRALLAGPRSG